MNNQNLKSAWLLGHYGCIGLDTDPAKIPQFLIKKHNGDKFAAMLEFNKEIIKKTSYLVVGYKINIAFYEQYGAPGIAVFNETISFLKKEFNFVFTIADVKRGDIGNTNMGYTYFLNNCDSMTISPWFGKDANKPFFDATYSNKIITVLAKTSNPGSADFQDKMSEGLPMYLHVVRQAKDWGNAAFVIGGTHPTHLLRARHELGEDGIILVPGIGAQGGDLKQTIQNGLNSKKEGLIINMSRSAIYASNKEDYAEAVRDEMIRFNAEVSEYLKLPRVTWEDIRSDVYQENAFKILEKAEAIIKDDHFVYQAGDHGPAYVAKDKVTVDPLAIDEIGLMIADLLKDTVPKIKTVVVPAVGGIVLGHVVAKYLSQLTGEIVNSIYIEKTGEKIDGKDAFAITRGYEKYIEEDTAVVEDILNSGHSVKSVVECIENAGGNVVSVAVICNRGNVKASDIKEGINLISLTKLDLEKFPADKCPLCKARIPINTTFGHGKKFLEQQAQS